MSEEDRTEESTEWLPQSPGQKSWGRGAQRAASVLWPSFLTASIGGTVFFAFVDPELIGAAMTPAMDFGRLTGYALGFFFFWFIALLSSSTTMFLGVHDKDARDN